MALSEGASVPSREYVKDFIMPSHADLYRIRNVSLFSSLHSPSLVVTYFAMCAN